MRHEESLTKSLIGQLVDSLPAWEKFEQYYLSSLLPSVGQMTTVLSGSIASTVNFPESDADKRSREARFLSAATQLRELLTTDEWASLGRLVHEYRTGSGPEGCRRSASRAGGAPNPVEGLPQGEVPLEEPRRRGIALRGRLHGFDDALRPRVGCAGA